MNFNDLEQTWNAPENRPSTAEIERQKDKLHVELRRRRGRFVILMTAVFAAMTFITVRIALQMLQPAPEPDRIDLAHEWVVIPMLVLPWAAVVFFFLQFRRGRAAPDESNRPIAESVRALLHENRISRTRSKTIAILHGAFLLLVPLVAHQLRAVGKAGDEVLLPAYLVWPLIATGIVLAILYHYRRKLLPEKQRLESLLKSYE